MKNKAAKPMPGWMVIPVVIFCAIAAVWIFLSAPEHIEDENGPDNYALHTITDGDIIKGEYGSVGGPKISKSILTGDAVEFSAEKFTGVADILWDNLLGRSDYSISVAYADGTSSFCIRTEVCESGEQIDGGKDH